MASTLDHGRFTIEARIRSPRFSRRFFGHDQTTKGRVLVATLRDSRYGVDRLVELLGYDLPGVAPFLFVGPLDGQDREFGMVEALPAGSTLATCVSTLTTSQRLDVARSTARIVQVATERGIALVGIDPELLYVADDASVTLAPRVTLFRELWKSKEVHELFGRPPDEELGPYIDPEVKPELYEPAADVYCWGLVAAFAFTGRHPYLGAVERGGDWWTAMQEDERDVFTGPPVVGRILERVLRYDPATRPTIHEVVAALDAIRPQDLMPAVAHAGEV